MCYLFPFVYEILRSGKDFRNEAFNEIIEKIKNEDFNEDFDIKKAEKFQFFQEKSGIVKLATQIGRELMEEYQNIDEDILV